MNTHENWMNPMNTHKIGFSAKNAKFSQTASRLSAYPEIYWKSVLIVLQFPVALDCTLPIFDLLNNNCCHT